MSLDMPGYKITEVLAGEGDRVSAGQILVRLTRPATEAAGPGATCNPCYDWHIEGAGDGRHHSQHCRGGSDDLARTNRAAVSDRRRRRNRA